MPGDVHRTGPRDTKGKLTAERSWLTRLDISCADRRQEWDTEKAHALWCFFIERKRRQKVPKRPTLTPLVSRPSDFTHPASAFISPVSSFRFLSVRIL